MSDIHWLIQNLRDVPRDDFWLSERERAIAARMYFEKRRQDWKLGRWCAKQAVIRSLKLPAEAAFRVEIMAASDGAPEAFLEDRLSTVSISISHSAGVAFCAVAEAGVSLGCDLEEIGPRETNFAADYFTRDEVGAVEKAAPADRDRLITLIWSAKESVLKALRQGLRRDTRSVQVNLPEDRREDWSPLSAVDFETSKLFHCWWRARENRIHTIASDHATNPPIDFLCGL